MQIASRPDEIVVMLPPGERDIEVNVIRGSDYIHSNMAHGQIRMTRKGAIELMDRLAKELNPDESGPYDSFDLVRTNRLELVD